MSIELRIGAPASGKTGSCIQKIRATLAERPLATVWTIVPDRLQAAAFRRRLALAGGSLGAHVGTFGDLYQSLLEEAGIFVPTASSALVHRLIQDTVDRAADQGQLQHFAALQTAPGFIVVLREAFAELKRGLVRPDQFLGVARTGTRARQELALLYEQYQIRLRELGWADSDGLSWLALEALENRPALASPIRLLVVDGFDSFTPAQTRALRLLAHQVGDVLITLPGKTASTRIAHRRFNRAIESISTDLGPALTSSPAAPRLPPDILTIESNLFDPTPESRQPPGAPLLLEARSPAEEAREALRWIKARVMRDNIPLTDCAVFAPNLEAYRPVLRLAAAESGITLRLTRAARLSESPAIAALLNLLSLPVQNYKHRPLFNSLRSTYFDLGLDKPTVDKLELISRVARVVEGQDQWDETWSRLTHVPADGYTAIDEERSLRGLPRGAEVKTLRDALDHFFAAVAPPGSTLPLTQWVGWLERLLEHSRFLESARQRDQPACEALMDALRAIVLSESVLGPREVDYARFLSDLQGTLEGLALPEPRVSGDPALLVGTLDEARGLRFQAVALLGLSEGVIPRVEVEDPFLDEELRRTLGLEPRLDREQAGLFYQAVTRTDHHLLVTRPYLSEDGEAWEPSPYWKAIQRLFDESVAQRIRSDAPRPLEDAISSQELLFWAVRREALPQRYAELKPRWEALRQSRDIVRARRAKEPDSPFEGSISAVAPQLSARYSEAEVWSPSRLELYGTCPHMFYAIVGLGLEAIDTPTLGLDASQIGSMLHKILEQAYKTATQPADPESVLAVLPEAATQEFQVAPDRYGFRPSPLWDVEQSQFLSSLEETIRALSDASPGWVPFAYEQSFGFKGKPALTIDLGAERLQVHGVIDRLDRNAQGELRVIDYKTGSGHLAAADLKDGRRLQLPIYGMAARDALALGTPVDGLYWAILAAKAGSLTLAGFKDGPSRGFEGAAETAIDHLRRIVAGIRAGAFPPVPPQGGCPSYCPAAQWCWRYEPSW